MGSAYTIRLVTSTLHGGFDHLPDLFVSEGGDKIIKSIW